MTGSMHRREWLGRGVAAVAALATDRVAPAARRGRRKSANERIGIALIGAGGMGSHHLGRLLASPDFEVLAVADVDAVHRERAVARCGGRAMGVGDYRRILERKDVDAVLIATPDHWHALQVVHACEAGLDVYCEKPLSLTVREGRAMADAARRYGRIVQTGTQQRSDARFHQAAEIVRNGKLGAIERVHVVLGPGPTGAWVADAEPPATLDWQMWLGPAPSRPYNPGRCHFDFRWFRDYSGGKLTDWGAHHLDIVQWALGTERSGPKSVRGSGTFPAGSFFETPVDFDVHYEWEGGIAVHVTGAGENGVTFHGKDGELFVSRDAIRARPHEILDFEVGTGPIKLPRSRDHLADWVRCLRTRENPISDAEIGHRSATVCHLGNIAIATSRTLRWDPARERFEGDEAADRLLAKPMRAPWSL